MKLLTLNTHSLIEANDPQKRTDFVGAIAAEMPDVIALQEVNQTADQTAVDSTSLTGYTPADQTAIPRADNHALNTVRLLAEQGVRYFWTWIPIKQGYGIFDEGIALLSLRPISGTDVLTVSRSDDYTCWKTRKLLGICCQDAPDEWFFSVHYGFWSDPDEPFAEEWRKTDAHMKRFGKVWLMGDFNSPAEVRGEGYDLIARSGWLDSYALAERRDGGITATHGIDGWRDLPNRPEGMRIDQIWVNRPVRISSSQVIFDNAHYPVISDHYGVMIETERSDRP